MVESTQHSSVLLVYLAAMCLCECVRAKLCFPSFDLTMMSDKLRHYAFTH